MNITPLKMPDLFIKIYEILSEKSTLIWILAEALKVLSCHTRPQHSIEIICIILLKKKPTTIG